ncbi:hypothetical protein MPLB_2040060 [Mesorhizobium sp. ORS 3324]|nr:hypothetical protein MPLB_2040060 [Mesorhizobium sp. ORS 3324]
MGNGSVRARWARTLLTERRAMNMLNLNAIPSPSRAATDLNYEADLKVALEPVLDNLLDRTEAAGWDRHKAAYTICFWPLANSRAPKRAQKSHL